MSEIVLLTLIRIKRGNLEKGEGERGKSRTNLV